MKTKKLAPDLLRLLKKYGIDAPKNECTKNDINDLIKKVDACIEKKRKGRLGVPNYGSRMLFSNVAIKAIFTAVASALVLLEHGLGNFPGKEENEKMRAKKFSFDVAMHMLISTDLLSIVFNEVAKTTDTNEKNQKIIAETLKLTALLLMIQTISKDDGRLIEDFSGYIDKSLNILGSFLNEMQHVPKGNADKITLDIQKGKIALEKGDINTFLNACKETLALLNISPDLLEKGLKDMTNMTRILEDAMTAKHESVTSIARAL